MQSQQDNCCIPRQKISHLMPFSLFGDFIANQFAVQSQRSLLRVSVESPFAEDSQCFATLRRLRGDSTKTALRIIRSEVAVKVVKV